MTGGFTHQKRRAEYWPDLEEALYMWIREAETQIIVSRETICEKARFFWMNIPMYKDKEMPVFSNGWLTRFQSRRGIKNWVLFGEDGSIDDEQSEQEMISVRQALNTYSPDNIFNYNETALY